ncbi:MAG: GNAT family N-acetyltransferase [Clostridiales bacterium]|nr:GNAT family N-acetyltransferase [Clostridiales bacterium]
MLRLRPYKPCDAETIVSWCDNEYTFMNWGGYLFGKYPIKAEDMNSKYLELNGDCKEQDNFYPMTLFDEEGIKGHMIMRYINGDDTILRFGWVILDPASRGRGYGKEMIKLGLEYAFEILRVRSVTIGVFENNIPAYHCYLAAGFRKSGLIEDSYHEIYGETWKIVELEISKGEYELKKGLYD